MFPYSRFILPLAVVAGVFGADNRPNAAIDRTDGIVSAGPQRFEVKHTLLAELGGEHVANAVHRRTATGPAIVGWGDRVVEWNLRDRKAREIVPKMRGIGYSNGGCTMDVTGDGIDEIITARGAARAARDPELCWFHETNDGQWETHWIAQLGEGTTQPHDVLPISFRTTGGKTVRGVVMVILRQQLVWFEIPDDPTRPWRRHLIADLPEPGQSGLAIGDVSGHQRPDLVCGMYWLECPADPLAEPWPAHRFGHWRGDMWAGMAKLQLADMDGDGRVEIVASQAEKPEAMLGIFRRAPEGLDRPWIYQSVDTGLYCAHSLLVTDLDADGRPDIIAGEMSAGGWKFPIIPAPRLLAYLNRSDGFQRVELDRGWGLHEMGMLRRSAGEPLVFFAAEETQTQKFPEMKTHVNLWTVGSFTRR